jgi:hypothetical protein
MTMSLAVLFLKRFSSWKSKYATVGPNCESLGVARLRVTGTGKVRVRRLDLGVFGIWWNATAAMGHVSYPASALLPTVFPDGGV